MNKFPAEPLLFSLLLLSALAVEADEEPPSADALPSTELLEFLGGWDTPEGDRLDPLLLAEDLLSQADTPVQDDE